MATPIAHGAHVMLTDGMSAHTHDDIDWADRLTALRRFDALERTALSAVAARLAADLPSNPVVVDVGSGAGGMSVALAESLTRRGGGRLILVDAVGELLTAAHDAATAVVDSTVQVSTVCADVGTAELRDLLPEADLVWAASVLHHLPDQQSAVNRLAETLRPAGRLAVAEGGFPARCLPWDLGVGNPGLEDRLNVARVAWFEQMRATMPGVVRMPYGWNTALTRAGLAEGSSFTYLVEHPAPADAAVREFAVERITWLTEMAEDRISDEDREAACRLVDPDGPDYLGHCDDVYLLSARTVYTARRP